MSSHEQSVKTADMMGITCERLGLQHGGECTFPQCNCKRSTAMPPDRVAWNKNALETAMLSMVQMFEKLTGRNIASITAVKPAPSEGDRTVQISVTLME